MEAINTVRVRKDWLQSAIQDEGSMSDLAKKLNCNTSTISRYLNDKSEAGPRFIGAVLANYAITFQDAFDVTEEEVKIRRARMVRTVAA